MRSTFEYHVRFADYVAATRRAAFRLARTTPAPWLQHALSLGSGAVAACAAVALVKLSHRQPGPGPNLALLALVALFVLCVLMGAWSYVKGRLHLRRGLSDAGPVLGPQRLDLEPSGLRLTHGSLESRIGWDAIRQVEDSARAVLLFVDHGAFVVIPASAFTSTGEREEFVNLVRAGAAPARMGAQLDLVLEASPAPPPTPIAVASPRVAARFPALAGFLGALARNLRAGGRLVQFRRVQPEAFSASVEQLIALVGIDLLLTFLGDFIAVGLHGTLNVLGLPGALFRFPLLVLACYVVARRERDARLALLVPIAVLAASQYISIASILLYLARDLGWLKLSVHAVRLAYYWAPYVWWLLVTAFALLCLTRRKLPGRLGYVALIAALVFLPQWFVPRTSNGPLWVEDSSEDESDRTQEARWYAVASEDAFYAQPEILRRRLDALAPGRPGVGDLYFVGVAGYAREDVFRKELSVISALFDQRFATGGRSISLINNPDTALQSPIATVTSLRRTLAHIGKLMNREKDVLVLYLTSHGSEDHRFVLDFWPLRLRDLDPPALRQMLDASGIRWRVIVVSACYSGGFIEPLKNDQTLVVTAADPHHTSFGCGSESNFTYFGKAYFDEALRRTHSFTDAFGIARRTIEARERAEGKTPSNPQMFVGPEIARKLRTLEQKWGRDG